MDYRPNGYKRAREGLEKMFVRMDREAKQRMDKPEKVKGPRKKFLEKYKVEGYDKAKEMINSKFGKEVYKDSILKQWIKEENENQK